MSHPFLEAAVPIKLDKERMLLVDFNALAFLEEKQGKSAMAQTSWQTMKLKDLRTMLTAALLHEDPSLTEKQVGSFVHAGNMKAVLEALANSWKNSFQGPEGNALRPLEFRPEAAATPV